MMLFVDGCHLSGPYKGLCWQHVRLMRTTTSSVFHTQLYRPKTLKIECSSCKASQIAWGFDARNYVRLGTSPLKSCSTGVWKREPCLLSTSSSEEFPASGKQAWYTKGSDQIACQGNVVQSCLRPHSWGVQCCLVGVEGL